MPDNAHPSSAQLIPAPAGISLAYQTAITRLEQQLKDVDQLDTKAGVGVAALVAAVGAYFALPLGSIDRYVGGMLLGLSVLSALYALFVRRYADAPDADLMSRYAGYDPDKIREFFLPAVLLALRENEEKIRWKGRLLNAALVAVGLLAVGAVVTRALNITA